MKMSLANIKKRLHELSEVSSAQELRQISDARATFAEFLEYLNKGKIRAAKKSSNGIWWVNSWVKESIIRVGFRLGKVELVSDKTNIFQFSDKDTLPLQKIDNLVKRNIRVVPGGSSIRSGSYIGDNVIVMPPSYINIGAYIGSNTMIDSLALVGSCAQIGKRVHIAAGAIIGGVLEPTNAKPCVVGDDAFIGAYAGIFNGVELGTGVVLAAKTVITESTEVWEALPGKKQKQLANSIDNPIRIPDRALVIPGNRQLIDEHGNLSSLAKNIVIIRGYYPKGGNAKLALNELLRVA